MKIAGTKLEPRINSASLDLDSLWKNIVETMQALVAYRSCSLVIGLSQSDSGGHAWRQDSACGSKGDSPEYCLGLAETFLSDRPETSFYTSEYLLHTDASSQARLDAWRQAGEVGWTRFVHLIFRDGPEVDAILSVRRDQKDGEFSGGEIDALRRLQPVVNAGLRRLREQARARASDAALVKYFETMPIPVLFLDSDHRLAFASRDGYEACAMWNFGSKGARSINPREAYELPKVIAAGCRQLAARSSQVDGLGEPSAAENERVGHPENPDLVAHITSSHPGRGLWARPGFFVTFAIERNLDGAAIPELRTATMHLRVLSSSERRVALLAAEGCGNATIAERLRKSKRTVECQLNSIYQKLGVNRVQLVRLLA